MSTIEDDDNKKRRDKYIDENDCKQQDYEWVFVRGKKNTSPKPKHPRTLTTVAHT